MKKFLKLVLMATLVLSLFAGCAQGDGGTKDNEASAFDVSKSISVVSREDGSGTRGAFIELFGIEVKGEDGSRKDMTTKEAIVADKTDVMMINIANDPYAIGYISIGSLNDTIKTLDIDGTKASANNVKNGTYKITRPFNIATKGVKAGLTKDFIDFILSKEGQEVVAKSYIAVDEDSPSYAGNNITGKITIAGSSSVTPIMEKLKERYIELNPNATIEIQMSDSTSGMMGTMEGTCDIGMASRDLSDNEKAQLTEISIALDGIAVIVNNQNPLTNISGEAVKSIFTGESIVWSDL